MKDDQISESDIDELFNKLAGDAISSGYNLNPDTSFTKSLVRGLLVNKKRYGYIACPCRLASGSQKDDLDIICACDYRDPDLDQYGACYCALYVDEEIKSGRKMVKPIPDRRFEKKEAKEENGIKSRKADLKYPVWRCKVCGYLCARDNPPAVCPVCKARKERFEIFY
ncbi:MAG: ferredoxin:glutaredoxin reductase [Actinobacteria bacterium]|nr:ferredoxin:glutaredoxin reductase [Actinomycetota bacterium]